MKRILIIGLCIIFLLLVGCGEGGHGRLTSFKAECVNKDMTYFDDNVIVPQISYECVDKDLKIHKFKRNK